MSVDSPNPSGMPNKFWPDILVLLGSVSGRGAPRRNGAGEWTEEFRDSGFRLLAGSCGDEWTGFPIRNGGFEHWRYWLLGELYDPGAQTIRSVEAAFTSPVAASNLNGHFLLIGWDAKHHRLHVLTDRFGTLHAYHAAGRSGGSLSTFFPAAAAVASQRKLDWHALTGFFSCGFFPADRTFFEDVQILRPASHYVFDPIEGLVGHERYWSWWYDPDHTRSYSDTLEEFGAILDEILEEQTSNARVAIPISGGLDSRTTVASLPRSQGGTRAGLWSYSYGYSSQSPEIEIAGEVALARGLTFDRYVIGPYLFDNLNNVLDAVEGFQDLTQCRQAAVLGPLRQQADYVIAAHWGDVWLDSMGLEEEEGGHFSSERVTRDAAGKVMKKGRTWLTENLCAQHLAGEDPNQLVRDFIRTELDAVGPLPEADFWLKAYKTDQWSFRWTLSSLRMYQPSVFPRLPFYDIRLADFFCTVPTEFLVGRKLQIDFLRRFAPDLAKIRWQAYGADLFSLRHHNTWRLPKRIWNKARRLILRERTVERNWEVQLLSPGGREGLRGLLLDPGLALHEFVSTDAISELVDGFFADPLSGNRGYTVSMLMSFSAWLERHG